MLLFHGNRNVLFGKNIPGITSWRLRPFQLFKHVEDQPETLAVLAEKPQTWYRFQSAPVGELFVLMFCLTVVMLLLLKSNTVNGWCCCSVLKNEIHLFPEMQDTHFESPPIIFWVDQSDPPLLQSGTGATG